MSYADDILPEFDYEMANARKVLERIPDDKLDWRAHPKSNTFGWNANHIAEIPGWVEYTLVRPNLDVATYQSPKFTNVKDILAEFDKNVESARKAIKNVPESALGEIWSLTHGDQVLLKFPKSAVIRTYVLNHLIHHRAHVCVYLRLNDIPVPGMYGPSGDDNK